ncbi:MAG TPA: oligosaccharide flippase family protein, partial [Solirubrobacteraceae bacterium]|nr:oligosaccharide flippase family protein [Solirubrobacteraceae bacterium]
MAEPAAPSIRRNAAFAFAGEATRAILAAIQILAVTRLLGPEQYGIYALAYTVGALALLPSDFGVSWSAARFIAERRDDRPAAAAVFGDALRLKIVLAGGISLVVAVAAGFIADAYGEPDLTWPLRITAVTLFCQSLFSLCSVIGVAYGRTSLQAVLYVAESATEATLVVTAAALAAGASEAALGRVGGFAVGALVGLVIVFRLLGKGARPRLRRQAPVAIGTYAGVLFLVDVAYALLSAADTLVIGALLSATEVGHFDAPLRMIMFALVLGTAMASAIAPRVVRGEGLPPDVVPLAFGLRAMVIVGCFGGAIAVAWATPIVDLVLGEEFAESADVLRVLGVYLPLGLMAPLATTAFAFLGLSGRRVPVIIAALVINTGLDLLLIPAIGIVGGAIGSLAAFAFFVPAHLWILHRRIELPLRPLGISTVRSLVAGGATAGVLALLGTGPLGPLAIVAGV